MDLIKRTIRLVCNLGSFRCSVPLTAFKVSSLPDLLLGVLAAECMGVGNGTDSRRGRSSSQSEVIVCQRVHLSIAAEPSQRQQTLCDGQAVHSETAPQPSACQGSITTESNCILSTYACHRRFAELNGRQLSLHAKTRDTDHTSSTRVLRKVLVRVALSDTLLAIYGRIASHASPSTLLLSV